MANECIPYFAGAEQITAVAGAAGINGKRFVINSGPLAAGLGTDGGVPTGVVANAAGAAILGVGAQDTASGLAGGVWIHGVVPVTTSAAIVAGPVMTDANGFAIQWTSPNVRAGYCTGDTASGADAPIRLDA
jgi:hypothetical protein